jgi:MHS family proline/betaine transporter-like MFS transporter
MIASAQQILELTEKASTPPLKKRYLIGCTIGNACEWYDFVIYGSLASILSVNFFPEADKLASLMMVFAVFAAGFLVRPLGGVIFGYIGDKKGRKKAFIYTILLMALPALAIGFLPTYNEIGRLAPILLLVCRLLQGMAVGGEYPIMITYIAELAPPEKRGYISCYANVTTVVGVFLATLTVTLITKVFSHEALVSFAWRIPFFLASLTILLGAYIRQKLPESSLFLSEQNNFYSPLMDTLKNNKLDIVRIFGYTICIAVAYYTFNVFSTTYFSSTLGVDYLTALYISTASVLFLIFLLPLMGSFSDKYGRKKMAIFSIISMILFIYPVYLAFSEKILWLSILSQFFFAFLVSLYLAPLPALLVEQTSTKTRCSTIAIGYNFALALFGGSAPMVNMYLIKIFESDSAPAIYLIITGIASLIPAFFMKDLTKKCLL